MGLTFTWRRKDIESNNRNVKDIFSDHPFLMVKEQVYLLAEFVEVNIDCTDTILTAAVHY